MASSPCGKHNLGRHNTAPKMLEIANKTSWVRVNMIITLLFFLRFEASLIHPKGFPANTETSAYRVLGYRCSLDVL